MARQLLMCLVLTGLLFIASCAQQSAEKKEAAVPAVEKTPAKLCDDLLKDAQRDVNYAEAKIAENKAQLEQAKAEGNNDEITDAESDIANFEARLAEAKQNLEKVKEDCS